jgi:hypothetical protein
MRIFSSAENFRRVMRRMSLTIFSAGSSPVLISDGVERPRYGSV